MRISTHSISLRFSIGLILLFALYALGRILIMDRFHVSGQSMEPTLHEGEPLWVEKWTMGARIYKSLDFESLTLSCFRVPGIGHLKPGDIAVFNGPNGGGHRRIQFRINHVFAKRIIGTPGDTVRIVRGFYCNSSAPGRLLCPAETQSELSWLPKETIDSVRMYRESIKDVPWSILDFGPLYIPAKGSTVVLDDITAPAYATAVEYETGRRPVAGETHTFKGDWFFLGGDNVLNSRDSRYFGLVPAEFIVGRVLPMGHKDRTAMGFRKQNPDLERALLDAGYNRGELERVLFHYANDARALKATQSVIMALPSKTIRTISADRLIDSLEKERAALGFDRHIMNR